MKALSIRQPWAWAILNRGKDIENRDWYTNFRGRVLIHTGKILDKDGVRYLESLGIGTPMEAYSQRGGIVGTVEIINCVTRSDNQWFFGKYGFVLRNPRKLDFMPVNGRLGFFEVNYP